MDGIVLKNGKASVVHNLKASLLIGNNAINMLGKIVIKNDKPLIYSDIKSDPKDIFKKTKY